MRYLILILIMATSASCMAQNKVKITFENGALKSEYVQEGELVAVRNYYETGELKETGFFKNEIPEGKWETFAKNGSKTAELNYLNGKRHGEFRVWDEFSDAYTEVNYVNGDIVLANRYLKQTEFAAKDR